MHERNLYTTPPNFTEFAKKYDFFAPFLTMDARGNPKINFKDEEALRALSRVLLLKDFGLDVKIPPKVLVPTIPLRLNYILWIEDLLALNHSLNDDQVCGIDIGTGATAVYALLGAKKNKWKMTGTEIFPEYVQIAQENVDKNKLSNVVSIIQVKGDTILDEILQKSDDGHYYFTMCNPPFFSNDEETDSVTKGRFSNDKPLRPSPSAAKTGQSTELVAEGGELKFVQNIIDESVKFSHKVRIFTTMIGIKWHLKPLINFLKTRGVINYTTTEFVQGKTMRWGLAWSFYPGIQLLTVEPDVIATFPNFSTLLNFESLIHSYLSELNLSRLEWLPSSSTDVEVQQVLEVIARENTWSHQSKMRRLMRRKLQREAASALNPPPAKIMKPSTSVEEQVLPMETCETTSSQSAVCDKPILIHLIINFVREDSDAKLVMRFREGTLGKDGVNQILQYIKNRYARDCNDPNSLVSQMTV